MIFDVTPSAAGEWWGGEPGSRWRKCKPNECLPSTYRVLFSSVRSKPKTVGIRRSSNASDCFVYIHGDVQCGQRATFIFYSPFVLHR